jgi:hypothetical protein
MRAFYLSVLKNYKRPVLRWEKAFTAIGGTITLYTDTPPLDICVYHANTLDGKRLIYY